jgi:hypothetical protein
MLTDGETRAKVTATATRHDSRAINRGADQARAGAALILGGLLLLTVP